MAGIDNIRSGQIMTTTSRSPARSDSSTTTSTESKKSTVAQDAVSLSKQGKAVSQMHQDLAASPAYDSAKVAAIKDAIANGSYKVDPEKLADNMIKFENELKAEG
ncbi:flagellar biosynthesis anti-sigma factor FlgM [Vibrio rotiferianus]|jgi:negative regulator of flagellin synthesis FlgM|uniref:flagellar biosynthesis anti-sigma factor FlgM n=1 Tax=Vibrio rotiferianus TaxID=190895 RepID=UPI000B59F995|nr:flagellar biosynthesis anti-sigma factor FlgM [Vibrio rotiferianus]ASI97114.1 flagellar biosynthesis anti-sigma factor FlgM [Vibrio rotiferianus]NOH69504.1 flagellar biosynthesis anti-sigma factor FlgM [Vibrio rotiferianus]TMX58091.1 flagellar biosynthesis anti-sigma factor FlgM [Vibrio rotiferianus]CAH1543145.1 Negative regulator of flagellin synthesis flgM [Vibrio rotiferianus]CAH1582094.1 Negative regulator of flagellin synthesis flgM [Vibrio rotiferianus]